MQGLFDEWSRRLSKTGFEILVPDFRRRTGIISDASKDLEKMPIPFELVLIIAMLRLQQLKRRCIVRLGFHFGGKRFVDLESISIIQVYAFHKSTGIVRVAPQ